MGPQSKFLALLQTLKDEILKEKEILSSKSNSEVLSESSNAIDIQNIEMVISEDDFNFFNNEQSSLNISPDESSSTQLFLQGMNSDDCSLGIQNIFPSENQSTYFIPYYKEGNIVSPNRGKLFDKYCNIKRKIIKINPSNKRKHDDEPQLNLCEDYEDSLTWLKNQVEPEIILHKLWNETSLHRLKLHKNDNMMNVYPALKKPTGHCLVDIDFAHLYPDKTMCLFQKFETFKNKLKIYLSKNCINIGSQGLKLFKILETPLKAGDDDLAAFQLIPFLLSPVNVALNNKQILRPSKIEQLHAFIVNIQNVNELKTTHRQKIDSALSLGLTVQPYVVVVGNINEADSSMQYFTIIDDVQFLLETLLKAIDLCFKLFHVLNLKYSPQAQQVWNFFEHYFYDISDQKKGRKFLSIQSSDGHYRIVYTIE
ncbi:uncharacterized protein LOC126552528 [Aphis gossypii]|uniref:uncharacterized protein LOC126552528 n=1 Tax=Aphis gossypii TaxID=80765 RepID=UPI002158D7D4|nr:uncharacterized protein LOC126552528 [Aphis gossypii]